MNSSSVTINEGVQLCHLVGTERERERERFSTDTRRAQVETVEDTWTNIRAFCLMLHSICTPLVPSNVSKLAITVLSLFLFLSLSPSLVTLPPRRYMNELFTILSASLFPSLRSQRECDVRQCGMSVKP